MAPHSSTLAWKVPWTEEPGGLQSMRSIRVRHDWATLLSLFTFMHWRRKWQPTPVFLPGESQGRGSLVSCLWSCTESDTTDVTWQQQQQSFVRSYTHSLLNHLIWIWLIHKKLYIFIVYNFLGFEISIHPSNQCHRLCHKLSITSKGFLPPPSLSLCVCVRERER